MGEFEGFLEGLDCGVIEGIEGTEGMEGGPGVVD